MSTSNGWHRKTEHTPAEQARAREYNSREYRTAKAKARRQVDTGHARCWRCTKPLLPGQPWHLGHDDHDRRIIRGPECVPCNLHAAAVKGARVANGRRSTPRTTRRWTSRDW